MGYSHGGYKIHETLQEQLRSKFNTQKITVINSANYGHFLTDDVTFLIYGVTTESESADTT